MTSTYFEGQAARNEKAARGYSRDQRSDCKQVCLGLVCTPEGLPLNFEIFAGHRADVTTVKDIVRKMEDRFGQAERIWVMDRGMVSEANIEFLRQRQARYIVGTPKSRLRDYQAQLAEKENWVDVENGVEARLVDHPDGDGQERYVLCRSSARGAKERAMLERQMTGLTEQMMKIDRALQRRAPRDLGKIERRIGRWQGKYPAAARLLEVALRQDREGRVCGLQLSCPVRETGRPLWAKGAYLLRTKLHGNRPGQTLALVYPTHPGRSRFPHGQKRSGPAPDLSSKNRPGRSPSAHLLFEPGPVAVLGNVDAIQKPRFQCPQSRRRLLHHPFHGCHRPGQTRRTRAHPAPAHRGQARRRCRPPAHPPRPPPAQGLQTCPKCSGEKHLKIHASDCGLTP